MLPLFIGSGLGSTEILSKIPGSLFQLLHPSFNGIIRNDVAGIEVPCISLGIQFSGLHGQPAAIAF